MEDMQNDFAFEQALSIVRAQAGVRSMTAQEVAEYTREIVAGIRSLLANPDMDDASVEPAVDPKTAVRENCIVCLECGAKFKVLSRKHLAEHGLTPAEYKAKWGLKKGTSLACRSLKRMRRQKMQSMQLWTRRKGAKAEAGAE